MTPKETSNVSDIKSILKNLSAKDFKDLGVQHIAYIKPVSAGDSRVLYSIHAADGSRLSVVSSFQEATVAARMNDLEPVTLH